MNDLIERVKAGLDTEGLEDDPDCLADMAGVFSVFRLRYRWATVYEVSLSNLADADDRNAAFGVLPNGCTFMHCLDTDTLGCGGEITLQFAVPTMPFI